MSGQSIINESGVNAPENMGSIAAQKSFVEKAMQGDKDALYCLCESVIGSILYHVKYMLGNEMDAEDVTQNILLRMCENIKGLREARAFKTWLGGIEINETRRFIAESCKHVNVVNIEDHADGLWEDNVDRLPRIYVEDRCPDRSIMEILSRLPVRQEEAIRLRYFDDLSVTEVAHVMKIPHQNVSRYLELALKKIKEELAKVQHFAFKPH